MALEKRPQWSAAELRADAEFWRSMAAQRREDAHEAAKGAAHYEAHAAKQDARADELEGVVKPPAMPYVANATMRNGPCQGD